VVVTFLALRLIRVMPTEHSPKKAPSPPLESMKKSLVLILPVALFFLWVAPTRAADISETFETYSDGQGLNALNGGTGWSAGWIDGSSACTISNSAPLSGLLDALCPKPAGTKQILRNFPDINTAEKIVTFKINLPNQDNLFFFGIQKAGWGSIGKVYFAAGGTLKIRNSSGVDTTVGGWTGATTYTVDFDVTIGEVSPQLRVRLNGGAWSAWVDTTKQFGTGMDSILAEIYSNGTAGDFKLDDITSADPAPIVPPASPSFSTTYGVTAIEGFASSFGARALYLLPLILVLLILAQLAFWLVGKLFEYLHGRRR
jgi:hypothetical protein